MTRQRHSRASLVGLAPQDLSLSSTLFSDKDLWTDSKQPLPNVGLRTALALETLAPFLEALQFLPPSPQIVPKDSSISGATERPMKVIPMRLGNDNSH